MQIGTITYSYRSMPDQSAEATLKYILDSGISAIELMGGPVGELRRRAGGGADGGGGRGRRRGRAGGAPGGARAAAGACRCASLPANLAPAQDRQRGTASRCATGRGGGGGGRRRCGGRGRGEQTPEQQAAQQEQAAKLKAWRTSVSMDPFKKLRKMYNDAGVTIYAWKQLSPEHVGRGVRVRLQRRRGARLHAHDAGTADRRRGGS